MTSNDVREEYLEYLKSLIIVDEGAPILADYTDLMESLLDFRYLPAPNSSDVDRGTNGKTLRYWFSRHSDFSQDDVTAEIGAPCTFLEMMIRLARDCEDSLGRSGFGNRTGVWFHFMINSMGLGDCTNGNVSIAAVYNAVERVNNHDCEYYGNGGLFTIPNAKESINDMSIWDQHHAFINYIYDLEYEDRKKGIYG